MSTNYNDKLIQQLKNIAKNAPKEKEFSSSTLKRWERVTAQAFKELGIDQFNYLNKKTPQAKQKALIQASNTLAKKVEVHEKRIGVELEKSKKSLKKKAKENLKDIDINQRTQNITQNRGLLPEKSDIDNMTFKEIKEANRLMEIAPELRALVVVQDYSLEYFERYFKGIIDEPGNRERIEKLAYSFGSDYVKLKDMIERTQSPSFKGGYGDTDDMLKENSDASHINVMYDRLSRLENEIFN